MRIGLISPLFESVPPRYYGGTERVVANLCRGLRAAGVDVTLFASGDSQAPADLVSVSRQALRLAERPVVDPHAYSLRMLAQAAEQAEEVDLFHNHHDYWMLPLSKMTDTPLLTTLHGRLDIPDIPAAFLSYPECRYVSISHSQRNPLQLLKWIRTIYHGIDTENYRFEPRPGAYLAFLGRISWDKRPDLAIQIAKRAGIPLKIAAKIEGPDSQAYYDTCIKPHIDGKWIQFLGEISEGEKSSFLGEALALVFPIDWPEPFGLAVVESLACGTPVLARPLGAMPEILNDGVTGFCDMDPKILADRVQDVERLDRGVCRKWAEERFSLQRMTEDYIDVYRELIATRQAVGTKRSGGTPSHRRNFLHSV